MPVLLLFMDARTVIVTTLILTSLLNALILLQTADVLKDAAPITIGSILGAVWKLPADGLNPEALKAIVAMLAILFSSKLMGFRRKIQHQQAVWLPGRLAGATELHKHGIASGCAVPGQPGFLQG